MSERATGSGDERVSAQRYEDLRDAALGVATAAANGGGLAVLMRSGMAGWMRAWARCTPAAQPAHRASAPQAITHGEVVTVLAEMALAAACEVTA